MYIQIVFLFNLYFSINLTFYKNYIQLITSNKTYLNLLVMNRHTRLFENLLQKYEKKQPNSKRKNNFFLGRLLPNAKSFSDWTVIFDLGDDSVRKDALREMKKYAISGKSREEIQLNILELWLVIDNADKDEILQKYLERYHEAEDFLFALDETDSNNYSFNDFIYQEAKRYGFNISVLDGIDERIAKRHKLLERSTFNTQPRY